MFITNLQWIAECLGIISLFGFALILSPLIINMVNHLSGYHRILLAASRWGLIIAIFSGLSHGLLMTQKENLDFYDLKTYWIYAEGLLTFNLLIILAFGFNEIKLNLKRFVYFVYALLFFIVCHLSATSLT